MQLDFFSRTPRGLQKLYRKLIDLVAIFQVSKVEQKSNWPTEANRKTRNLKILIFIAGMLTS
jgi:hypothetical protein